MGKLQYRVNKIIDKYTMSKKGRTTKRCTTKRRTTKGRTTKGRTMKKLKRRGGKCNCNNTVKRLL
jgi:hypothetical protein